MAFLWLILLFGAFGVMFVLGGYSHFLDNHRFAVFGRWAAANGWDFA